MQLDLLASDDETRPKGPALRKLYYSISEVSELVSVPAHVIRYWESEFPQINPKKAKGGNRLFQEKDINNLLQIKSLLYDHKFTIAGAKAQLSTKQNRAQLESDLIKELTMGLKEILDLLNRKA